MQKSILTREYIILHMYTIKPYYSNSEEKQEKCLKKLEFEIDNSK